MDLAISQALLFIMPVAQEWLLTFSAHKMLQQKNRGKQFRNVKYSLIIKIKLVNAQTCMYITIYSDIKLLHRCYVECLKYFQCKKTQ